MGVDESECDEHEWVLAGIDLSLMKGAELTESCACGATRTVSDDLRNQPGRPKLPPTLRLRGE